MFVFCLARGRSRLSPFLSCMVLSGLFVAITARAQEHTRGAFSQIAVGVAVGTQGVGGEVATPLLSNVSLRGGADFLKVNSTFATGGDSYTAHLALESGYVGLDWAPFHGSFRLTPGVLVYNGSNVGASVNVAPGQSFTLNHTIYYSSATDPLAGTVNANWPKAGARFTFGWGNMLPKNGRKHFAWTSEFGVAYFGSGAIGYAFTGSECSTAAASTCAKASTDSEFNANVAAEQAKIQKDMAYARFFPILRTGLSWRF